MSRLHRDFLGPPIAHRGLHDRAERRIENSRAAVAAAVEAGYGVEIDVQASADGEAMVFHDDTLDRLTGETGPIRARSATELRAMRLRGSTETIPTLAEILALATTPLLVEIKDQSGCFGPKGVGPLAERVAALLAAHPGPVAVMSFNPDTVAAFAEAAPAIARGLTAGPPEDFPGAADPGALARLERAGALGADFVSYNWRALPTPETAALRARAVPVLCWTIRSAEEEAQARRHADNVTFEGYAAATSH
jgi:glycerophosphoryl diester phosphodiesterase